MDYILVMENIISSDISESCINVLFDISMITICWTHIAQNTKVTFKV